MALKFVPRNVIKLMGRPNSPSPMQSAEKSRRHREKKLLEKINLLAVLDFETDPFDNNKQGEKINPFAACLYSENFQPIIIWENEPELFLDKVVDTLENLPKPYTIYAHNGGKFDFMFLVKRLRGKVSFKGRGIMSAKVGRHELRDSFHLIPEKLAAYKKDDFDYKKLLKHRREKHKSEIVEYMQNDCVYLYDIVKSFLKEFGFKISIGQAAMAKLKETYTVGRIGENTDAQLRPFFFGGRVECLAGKGHFKGAFKMYDVNSMYPHAMAHYKHPISSSYTWRRAGGIKANTIFLTVECQNNGALVKRGANNETSAKIPYGVFQTTIWEFKTAVELGLISKIKILKYVDNDNLSTFEDFILPIYAKRQLTKIALDNMSETDEGYDDTKKESIFLKLLMNNAYGKFAQNPRRFTESFITDHNEPAPAGYEEQQHPIFMSPDYDIWQRPTLRKQFNNVGTAASITGAARSILMRAIHSAVNPIYCDTDSLICEHLNMEIDASKLGSWKFEKEFDEIIIAGKKLYAVRITKTNYTKIKSKGAPNGALKWKDMLDLLDDKTILVRANGPTLTKTGKQYYMERTIRATA